MGLSGPGGSPGIAPLRAVRKTSKKIITAAKTKNLPIVDLLENEFVEVIFSSPVEKISRKSPVHISFPSFPSSLACVYSYYGPLAEFIELE